MDPGISDTSGNNCSNSSSNMNGSGNSSSNSCSNSSRRDENIVGNDILLCELSLLHVALLCSQKHRKYLKPFPKVRLSEGGPEKMQGLELEVDSKFTGAALSALFCSVGFAESWPGNGN